MRYNQTFPALESFDPELSFFVAEHTPEPADTPPFADIPTHGAGYEEFIGLEVTDLTDYVEHVSL